MRGGSRQEGLGGCVVSSLVWGNEHDRPCINSARHLRRGGTRQGVSDGCSAVRKDGDRRQLRGFGDTVRFYLSKSSTIKERGGGYIASAPFYLGISRSNVRSSILGQRRKPYIRVLPLPDKKIRLDESDNFHEANLYVVVFIVTIVNIL